MTHVYTALALTAFAANSLLCRLALGGQVIDAVSFTSIRLMSGAAMLLTISFFRGQPLDSPPSASARGESLAAFDGATPDFHHGLPGWRSVTALFIYAIAFSWAYVSLTAGTGALILFGAVQTTMLVAALGSGERPRLLEWVGLLSAIIGLVVLVFPGLSAPPVVGSTLMALAGISWGLYSLWGRGTTNPLTATTMNFVRAAPLALVVSLVALGALGDVHVTAEGAGLAVLSGAVASGVGYVIWYAALRELSATRAATVQLAVPVIAALGGVVFLSETISTRLMTATAMIIGGIALATSAKRN